MHSADPCPTAILRPALAQAQTEQAPPAIELKPHPTANISEAQWAAYFARVKTANGKSMQRFPEIHVVVFEDGAGAFYAFTEPGHPAASAFVSLGSTCLVT